MRGLWSSRADVALPEDLLIAQDAVEGVLLVVQELLEGREALVGVSILSQLLPQPAVLVRVVLKLQ